VAIFGELMGALLVTSVAADAGSATDHCQIWTQIDDLVAWVGKSRSAHCRRPAIDRFHRLRFANGFWLLKEMINAG
jgi:hypothetical protein